MFSCSFFSVIAHITVIKQQSNSKANGFGRKTTLNFGEDLFFFFFWRSPDFGRKNRSNFRFRPKIHSQFRWRQPNFWGFGPPPIKNPGYAYENNHCLNSAWYDAFVVCFVRQVLVKYSESRLGYSAIGVVAYSLLWLLLTKDSLCEEMIACWRLEHRSLLDLRLRLQFLVSQ